MNWIKSKKQRIVIIISVALILCSFSMIPLSRKSENFPHDIWSNLIFLMTTAGGGGIGAVISLHIMSRRSKQKRNISQNSHTNRLKKKAWIDFGAVCAGVIAIPLVYGSMTYADIKGTQGATYLLAGLVYAGVGVGFMIFLTKGKQQKQFLPQFDERELHLIHRAINIGNNIFIFYTLLVMTAAFYIIGGRAKIPMWSIPIAFSTGFFIAGTAQFLVLHRN
ncbi:MAG: hypothetical protein ACYTFX_04945 [Planctomycetota bacterium]|jgi:MFS family permease